MLLQLDTKLLYLNVYKQMYVTDNYESVSGDAPSWKEAIQRCVDQQNSYPVNSESSTSLCNKTSITWTSIFRDVFIAIDNTGMIDVIRLFELIASHKICT